MIRGKFILALIAVYPLLFIWQGLDFTDTGYMLTNYQQIFNDPMSIASSFRIWLTVILGGTWTWFFGDALGLFGYRLAAVLLVYATLYPAYLILKPYVERKYLLGGLFLALVFINRTGFQFNYNSMTAFFYVLAAYFLVKGLEDNKNNLVFFGAFTLGINIFVRLPNILGFFLILSIFFSGYLHKNSFSLQLKQVFYFLLGYLSAILAALTVMYLLGHLASYIAAFNGTFTMLNDPYGHHRKNYLVDTFFVHHGAILRKIGLILFNLTTLSVMLTISARLGRRILQYVVILITAAVLLYFYHEEYRNWIAMLLATVGVLYAVLAALILGAGRAGGITCAGSHPDRRFIAFVALLILVLLPLGSNVSIRNSIYGMYLAIPLVSGYLFSISAVKISFKRIAGRLPAGFHIRLLNDEITLIKILSLAMFLVFTLQSAYYYTYRDAADRTAMVYGVKHDRLKWVFTTRERARVVDELTDVLPRYVKEDDYLLAYEQISMVYFLTKTRPYLYSAWPMLYSPEQFNNALQRAQQERPYLPVIVRARGDTEKFDWPGAGGMLRSYYHDAARQTMERFIRENQYRMAWQNSFFEILVPPEKPAPEAE
ncbi:MAG: hypothetical protein ACOY4Q_14245 [Bacillota bacterium]